MTDNDDGMQRHTSDTQKVPKRPSRPRSTPHRGDPPREASTVGEVYLETFSPPALASTSDVYMQTYAVVRAILEGMNWRYAATAAKAAHDAAAQHVEQQLSAGGDHNG
ncbi:hypothetical protein BSZ35_19045 [Salinibacter sp. 10B]|uniref:hypothetical protein n=1 Tax=Salinibacter sp. 10B TaxID=1923971 RepID=UPI000CF363E4|nr:hypothetical protein [Salinibacter sp. 10B]PQJ26747.1 hypothetical protein BSZ35_19045 [Salinibacter sp. 10B]